jgi:hypothetical protein
MEMKQWPEDNKPASFEDLVKPFVPVLRFAYKMKRQNADTDIPYNGFEHNSLHVCFPMVKKFSAEQLAYDKDEQGRDALEVIIGAILQVGIEQGRRIALESSEVQMLRTQAKISEILLNQRNSVD